ncbi:hypothetical protein LY78DRAFT_659037 [Colletotrichum sublineola]|nr:hypothetical protein LY78DRAFT_659037 [Colletotrichum sublineola]
MCLAEHIYYINCGCWKGWHIRWQCPRGNPRGAGACPDVECSGVFRKWGRCLVCQRRQAQQRRQQQHVLVTRAENASDISVTFLHELIFQTLGGPDCSSHPDNKTTGSIDGGQPTRDARRGSASAQGPGRTSGPAWHR